MAPIYERIRPNGSSLRRAKMLLLALASLGLLAGCGEDIEDDQEFSSEGSLVVEEGPFDAAGDGESEDAERTAPTEEREALLAIFEGRVTGGEQRYEAELMRTVDAELYRDVDRSTKGPKQWITRAKVVDADGETLWQDRVNVFFQLIEYLTGTLDEISAIEFGVEEIYTFVEANYPNLLEFGVRVPIGIEGAEQFVLEVPDQEGNYYEVVRENIGNLKGGAEAPEIDGEVETLQKNGPPRDRTDVVILADGYTEGQKSTFLDDAQAVVDRFGETEPFESHLDLMNFHVVWTPSEEEGAGYDCVDEESSDCQRFRNTVYRFTFATDALADELNLDTAGPSRIGMPLEIGKMYEAAALAPYDEVVMLSNSDRRSGFAGMYAAVLTAFDDRNRFPDVAIHEFGHTFGVLGDEYHLEGDPCLDNTPRIPLPPNISQTAQREDLKWSHWVPDDVPLPTPEEERASYSIGAFKKARNCDDLYRPAYMCMMRRSGRQFCKVCSEQLVRRFYKDVDLLRPGFPKVVSTDEGALRFESGVRAGGDRSVTKWRLGGDRVGQGPALKLRPEELAGDQGTVRLKVREFSTRVRKDDPRLRREFEWRVRRE